MVQRVMLALAIAICALVSSSYAQVEIQLIDQPVDGIVRPLPDGKGFAYLGTGSVDSFTVACSDEFGSSLMEVSLDPTVGHDLTAIEFGGPLPVRVLTFGLPADQTIALFQEDKPKKDEGYVVIVYVDQPGKGGDRDPYEGSIFTEISVGHTFIKVVNGKTGKSRTHGLYPSGGVKPSSPESPGVIRNDAGHDWDVKLEIPITKKQYDDIIKKIDEDKKKPPTYNLNDKNCTDWVLCLLKEIDESIDATEGTWDGGGGHNPGDLGEDLIPLGGKRNPKASGGDGSSGK